MGTEPTHFDFMRAKEQKSGDWLVLHLGELVALAYQVKVSAGLNLDCLCCFETFFLMSYLKFCFVASSLSASFSCMSDN